MKGYISFLLVFAAVVSLFSILAILIETNNYNQSKAIGIEQLYQQEMNLKEVVRELARQGAREGFLAYSIEVVKKVIFSGGTLTLSSAFNSDEAKSYIRNMVYAKLSMITLLTPTTKIKDYDAVFWCSSSVVSSAQLLDAKEASFSSKTAAPCSLCTQVPDLLSTCRNQIGVDVFGLKFDDATITTDDIGRGDLIDGVVTVYLDHFGFSLYSNKYNIVAVGYIPLDAKVEVKIP